MRLRNVHASRDICALHIANLSYLEPMTKNLLSRRDLLRKTVAASVAGFGLMAVGCGGESELRCTDTAGLTPAEQATRSSLGYVDNSPHGAQKDCANCQLFEAAAEGQCGGCTLLAGPINPKGYCNSWVAKTS